MASRRRFYLGARCNAPFIPVNCGAIPDSLVESEFFGHTRGAFTDAKESRTGVIEQAERGTLFLDELEVLSPRLATLPFDYRSGHPEQRRGVKPCAPPVAGGFL